MRHLRFAIFRARCYFCLSPTSSEAYFGYPQLMRPNLRLRSNFGLHSDRWVVQPRQRAAVIRACRESPDVSATSGRLFAACRGVTPAKTMPTVCADTSHGLRWNGHLADGFICNRKRICKLATTCAANLLFNAAVLCGLQPRRWRS